jgi:hypothetical protein
MLHLLGFKQDSQCTHNVTVRRFLVTAVVVGNSEYYSYILRVCVCGLRYPACNVHAPYYIGICNFSGSTVYFPHYLINGTIFFFWGGVSFLT